MTQKDFRLVLLETSGNQGYIFATNKLRDIIGGSELTFRAGTFFLEEAIKATFPSPIPQWTYSDFAADPTESVEISDKVPYEVLLATSGKALVLVAGKDNAKALVTNWSRIMLDKAPGIDALGVFTDNTVDLSAHRGKPGNIADAMREVHELFERARVDRPAVQARFQNLPVFQPCSYSGLPATDLIHEGSKRMPASLVSIRKTEAKKLFGSRLRESIKALVAESGESSIKFADTPKEFDAVIASLEQADWLAVIHADGNGMGQVFLSLDKYVQAGGDGFCRAYITLYRGFSAALDRVTTRAFLNALTSARIDAVQADGTNLLPVMPVVIGGDDLTVIMPGKKALAFTRCFIDEFGNGCSRESVIRDLAKQVFENDADRFGTAAGVGIIKPHFPFFTAYEIVEELVRNAKNVKREASSASSAIDFHVMYDSTANSLVEIRDKLNVTAGMLTTKPFVVGAQNPSTAGDWTKFHDWNRFRAAVDVLRARKNGKMKLPNSQAHAVREHLFGTPAATLEAEWALLLKKYEIKNAWGKTAPVAAGAPANANARPEDLFADLRGSRMTVFLDALETLDFES